jgi:hypothetical protein
MGEHPRMPTLLADHPGPVFTTVADGVLAQVVRRQLLPPHLSTSSHEGRAAGCGCRPLLDGLTSHQRWVVVPRGAREACTQEDHQLEPLRHGIWREAPAALRAQAHGGSVELLLTMCAYCGAVEVRDVSFHAPAGLALGRLAPRRRSDVLGWYAGARPAGRVYT